LSVETENGLVEALNQQTGYYEVSLEVSFSVLNSKLGIVVIAGRSTLFLEENQVYLVSDTQKFNLKES
jgi:hypothetical protein